jgi:MerR family copper efflux transcriptional regulator
MTIGALSRRTGVPVKALREYEDLGLIYTVGRSAGNYRLFSEEALWCLGVIGTLRRQVHILATRDAGGLPAAAAPADGRVIRLRQAGPVASSVRRR